MGTEGKLMDIIITIIWMFGCAVVAFIIAWRDIKWTQDFLNKQKKKSLVSPKLFHRFL